MEKLNKEKYAYTTDSDTLKDVKCKLVEETYKKKACNTFGDDIR